MDQSVADFYGIDLKKLTADALASGYNPLTIIRNGGLAAYMLPVNPVATAPTELVEYGGGEITYEGGGGGGGGGGDFFSYAYYDDWNPKADAKSGKALSDANRKANSPMVYYEQAVQMVREAGGTPVAIPQGNGGSGPGSTRVRTSTTPAPSEPKMKEGFQQAQIWDKDKQPNVIKDSTFHYILPGITWEELGGTTRGEFWETAYGEETPGAGLLGVPKYMNDIGHNWLRFGGWMNNGLFGHDNIPAAIAASTKRVGNEIAAQPTYRDSSGRVTFQEPSNIGLSAGSNSVRPTLSYAASKEASKSSSTVTKSPSATTKDKDKEKASTPSSSSTSSKTKSSSSNSKSDSKSGSSDSKKKK